MRSVRRLVLEVPSPFAVWVLLGLISTIPSFYYLRAALPDPLVNVQWAVGVGAAQRADLEARFGLNSVEQVDVNSWSYRLGDSSRSNIAALVGHPDVADTHKIDRQAFQVEERVPLLDTLWRAAAVGVLASSLLLLGVAILAGDARAGGGVPEAVLPDSDSLSAFEPALANLHRLAARLETLIVVAMAAGFLLPLLVYGPYDQEESGLGFFASQVYYRDLFAGQVNFWLNGLGFGTPMPIGQRFDFHPVFALGSLASLRLAVSATWIVQVALMLFYFRRLAALLGIGPVVRIVLAASYLFSAPSVNYFYVTDWLSHVVGWSVYPVLAFYLLRVVIDGGRPTLFSATRLALLGAFWILNSHAGYIAPLALVLALFVVLVAPPKSEVYGCLAGAVCLCAIAVSERSYFLVSEAARFPPELPRLTQGGNSLWAYAVANAVPFTHLSDGMRQPFIGVAVAVAAFVCLFRRSPIAGVNATAIAFAAAGVFGVLPDAVFAPFKVLSGIWFFRDPAVFFGLLAAGVALQRGLDSRHTHWRFVTVVLLAAQLLQQGAAVSPGLQQVAGRGGPLEFYRHQRAPVQLAATLVDRARAYGPRLYVSEPVRRSLRGGMSTNGIHSVTDLVLFGLNPVNGWFKNVSMDSIHPSTQLMHGIILGQREVIAHQPLLDVLGINLVWATAGDGPFPRTLLPTDRWRNGSVKDYQPERHDLVLLANPQAWPRAVLLRAEAAQAKLPLRPGCPHRAALCRDFSALARQRLPETVELDESNGRYVARFRPASEDRLLFISAGYRPEWEARSAAGRLPITPAAGAFLGVTIPAGVEQVDIRFETPMRALLTWISALTLLALVAMVGVSLWRRRSAASAR